MKKAKKLISTEALSKKEQKLKGAEAFGVKIKIDKSLDNFSDKVQLPEKYKMFEEAGFKLVDGTVNRDEALRSAGFTEEFIKHLHELEKAAPHIDYDTDLDLIYPEIC